MLADQPLFKSAKPDVIRKSGLVPRLKARSNPAVPLPSKGEDVRPALLDYAAFLLDQEAKYCQQ